MGDPSDREPGTADVHLTGPDPRRLTPRQLEVLRLIGKGLTDAQIADALFLSRRTVHAHVRAIFRTLDVSRRSAATRYALQHGLT